MFKVKLFFSAAHPLTEANICKNAGPLHATPLSNQLKVLLRRGIIMCKRDTVILLFVYDTHYDTYIDNLYQEAHLTFFFTNYQTLYER